MSLNRGGFGIIKRHDSGACGNAEGTRKLIENFCTKFYDPPDAPKSGAQPTLDVSLLRHIQNVTEAITIDAASYEVASARDLTSSSSFTAEQIAQPFMPNLHHILRDKMHACWRVLMERPWSADSILADWFDVYVSGKQSLPRLIQNSFVFRQWLTELSAQNSSKCFSSTITNLRAAKHRMESQVTPLSRMLCEIEAMIAIAMRISHERKEREKKAAEVFLGSITEQILITLALLADAGCECMELLRKFDTEEAESGLTTSDLQTFLDKIVFLFVDEHIWKIEGHTKLILDWHAYSRFTGKAEFWEDTTRSQRA